MSELSFGNSLWRTGCSVAETRKFGELENVGSTPIILTNLK